MHNIELDFIPTFILGASVLAFIYHAVLLIYNRDKFMIPYLVYLFCTAVFMYSKSGLYSATFGQMSENYMMWYFREAIQIIYLTSYFNFIIEAIGLSKTSNLFLFRYWIVAAGIMIAYALWSALSHLYFPMEDYSIPFIAMRVYIFAVTGIMLYQSFKLREDKFQLIILYGCLLYFILGLVSFVTNFYHDSYGSMIVMPLEWMMVGSFIDIIFFSFAVGYRNRKEWEKLNSTLLNEANKHIALQQVVLEKQAELENERTRIAADMHDDLGSGLTRITYLSQMALKSDTENNLQKIKKTASELVGNMSELIWVMKEENNTLEDLATYIKSYAVDYFENNQINCSIRIPETFDAIMVNGNHRRNLFLSVKESLHNIVKHAKADHVKIDIAVDGHLQIDIHDNGIGIAKNQPEGPVGGNGLRNMRKRIESMNGEVSIENQDGTKIYFRIPLSN
ncbi:ATP-binding protein [Flavobacterium sp.]|uniref:sensor histidine kinase n=1 Tax=Flavobacterium sp. TaxID=239 RepID=UPI0039E402D9